ncbi:MAG: bifunctional DNA-formamidopyrimidine glycosylase/DNA-(apurinic or apyrimidinic site) lyase [Patescibacteria group bacterium]|nr:bifunctional DNA-formamidopyrimidine glycosylase/DNA-(apurinic or apyrimidinic site) lyase [Patescibacteria group bacterium]
MPELPEVETIKKYLEKLILNKKIVVIEVFNKNSLRGEKKLILGKKIKSLKRKGKLLVIELNNDYSIIIHLKMSGQLIYSNKRENLKYLRIVFKLNKGYLFLNDLRKFAWIKIIKKDELKKEMDKIGVDIFDLSFKKFQKLFKKSKQNIKSFLMNQKKISGIGNIYASEILFLAKINPLKKTNDLKDSEIKKLFFAIKKIIKKAIKYEGSSSRLYLKPNQQKGSYQEHFLVYQRENENCYQCQSKIKRIKINNRSTFYCPNCQK